MAGIAGMGSSKQLPKVDPQQAAIQGVDIPQQAQMAAPAQQEAPAEEDFGSLIDSALAEPAAEEDFSGLIDQALSGKTQDEFSDELPGFMDRLGEIPARAKASFAITDKEIKQSLEQSFGKDRVRTKDGDVEYKGKDDKWRVWDAGTTIEDFTIDMARPLVEEIPASAATIAAAIPAVASTIGTGGAAAPLGAGGVVLARAGGAVAGQGFGDLIQTQVLGIDRDPNRNAALEYGATAVLAPAAGALADFATKKIAQRAAQSQARKLLPPDKLYKEEIAGIKEALDVVKKTGGMENLPGTNTPVMLYHLNPSNPMAAQITNNASTLKGYAQMEEHLIQNFDNSTKSFLETLGTINPDNMKTGQEFKSYVQEARAKEGKIIGNVRETLVDAAGTGELPVPKLKGKIEKFAGDLGFNLEGETNISGLKTYLVEEMGYSKQAADVVVNKTNRMLEKVTNKEGRMTAKEIVGAYEEMNGLYKNVMSGGQETSPLFRQKVGEMRRFLADELIDKSEVILDKETKAGYVSSLKNYGELVNASAEFSTLLDKNNVASHSLSKSIFSKGANGLDSAEAVKVLLRDRPDLLNEVKGSFLQDTIAKSQNKLGKTDWVKFNNAVLNPEMRPVIESMFGKESIKGFKAYETVGKAIQNGNIGAANSPSRALFLKNMALAGNSVLAAGNAALESLKQVDAENAFMQIVNKEGIDNFIKTAPKDSKPFLKKALGFMQETAYRSAQISEIPIRRTGKRKSVNDANQVNSDNEEDQ